MADKKEEGAIYISAAGAYYAAPSIDAGTLYDCLQNGYLREQLDKASSKIFNGMYKVTVKDQDGNELEDVTQDLEAMMEAPMVAMWSRMKQAWEDIFCWGCSLQYPKWARDGARAYLQELRRLPPESFATPPNMLDAGAWSELLQGITLNEKGELELWQDQGDLQPVKLKTGCLLLKDPTSTKLAGSSKAIFLVPIIKMMDFAWESQMQKVNRIGAPIMFIKITGQVSPEDKKYAQAILKNWGKGKAYQLRDNMELVGLEVQDTDTALDTIAKLEKRLEAPFRAGSTLDKEGSTIGGNAAAQKEAEDDWVLGQRAMIEDLYEGILQHYLDLNAYEGCTVELQISVETSEPGDLEINQARAGFDTGTMSINEIRAKLGQPEKSPEEIDEMLTERAKLQKALGGKAPGDQEEPAENPFGGLPMEEVQQRADIVKSLNEADPMDPERYMSQDAALKFLGLKGKA